MNMSIYAGQRRDAAKFIWGERVEDEVYTKGAPNQKHSRYLDVVEQHLPVVFVASPLRSPFLPFPLPDLFLTAFVRRMKLDRQSNMFI